MYEGVQLEVLNTTRFDESSDLSTTYLGRTDITRTTKIKAEGKFVVPEQGYMVEKTVRWYRMSHTVRHRSKQIIYAKVIMCKM